MNFNVQGAKGLTIPEGTVKTIHDKDNRLLWGAVGYNTKYAGDTFQQTYSGKNLFSASQASRTDNNVTSTIKDGVITLNGTTSYAGTIGIGNQEIYYTPEGGDTYTFTIWLLSGTATFTLPDDCGFYIRKPDGTSYVSGTGLVMSKIKQYGYQSTTFTAPSATPMCFLISANKAGIIFDNVVLRVQIEKSSTRTDWEPYVGGLPSPSPEYPEPISIVTGEQTVKVTGKNLMPTLNTERTLAGVTFTPNPDGSITLNGTSTEATSYPISADSATVVKTLRLEPGTYTLNGDYNDGYFTQLMYQPIGGSGNIYARATFTLTEPVMAGEYLRIRAAGYTFNNVRYYPQLEAGSTATAYEPYQAQSHKVNLEGKNLWGGKDKSYVSSASGFTATYNMDGTLSVTGTASSRNWSALTNSVYTDGLMVELPAGTYTFTVWGGKETQLVSTALDGTGETANVTVNSGAGSVTFTTSATRLFYPRIRVEAGATEYTVGFMIEAGSTATAYEPYFTPIELCGIEKKPDGTYTYQDYIWRDGADWKIHKEVGKVVLTGSASESWGYNSNDGVFVISDLVDYLRTGFVPISDYYTGQNISGYSQLQNMHIAFLRSSTSNRTVVKNTNYTSATDFKTWLSTHNTTVYYALATPTDTAITDETLIAQLNAIEEWMTRYGYVGAVFGNLPMIIDRTTI